MSNGNKNTSKPWGLFKNEINEFNLVWTKTSRRKLVFLTCT